MKRHETLKHLSGASGAHVWPLLEMSDVSDLTLKGFRLHFFHQPPHFDKSLFCKRNFFLYYGRL